MNRQQRRRHESVVSRKSSKAPPQKHSDRVRDAYHRLSEADKLRKAGNITAAIRQFESLIDDYPDYVGALHLLGLAHMAKAAYWPALSCFVRAAMLNPGDWTILASLAQAYLGLGAQEMAARTLEQARTINDEDAEIQYTLGLIYDREREYERAVAALRRALSLKPDHELAAFTLGLCLVHLGDLNNAAEAFLTSHETNPELIAPIAATAQLPPPVRRFDAEKALPGARHDPGQNPEDIEIRKAYTRAHILHGHAHYDDAWAELVKANAPLAKRNRDNIRQHEERRTAIMEHAKSYKVAPSASDSDEKVKLPMSLFILGVSRSGKTTLERALATIPGVRPGYENPIVEMSVRRTTQQAGLLTMNQLGDLPARLENDFADHYRRELIQRAAGADVFTNTHPGRIADVGKLITLIPNVRFLFVVRNREDTALRIYMKHYREGGNLYAYDLKTALSEIDWYHEMIRTCQARYPEFCRTISYEQLVEEPGVVLHSCARFLGIDAETMTMPVIGDDRGCSEPYREYF